jgi:hypothetical protein
MPIIYVHGVNVRSRDGFLALTDYLRRYLAPVIADDPENVLIDDVFWGDKGVSFAWGGQSRPRSQLIGMGAGARELQPVEGALAATAFAAALDRVPEPQAPAAPATGGLAAGGPGGAAPPSARELRLSQLSREDLSDFLTAAIIAADPEPSPTRTARILAADAIAMDPATGAALARAKTPANEVRMAMALLQERGAPPGGRAGMGGGGFWADLGDRVSEATRRALGLPTYAASVVAAELRKPLNDMVSVFLGDVMVYLQGRGAVPEPGPIQRLLLDKLSTAQANAASRNDEPLVVLTHSMGGQLVWDAVSHFMPRTPALRDVRIDFWCATASQVGFFEDAKLFIERDPAYRTGHPVPFPKAQLGHWWNVWDHNDFISFTAKGIVDGVDDEAYSSGMSLISAHGGYLERPSFFRQFALKLEAARAKGWSRP